MVTYKILKESKEHKYRNGFSNIENEKAETQPGFLNLFTYASEIDEAYLQAKRQKKFKNIQRAVDRYIDP